MATLLQRIKLRFGTEDIKSKTVDQLAKDPGAADILSEALVRAVKHRKDYPKFTMVKALGELGKPEGVPGLAYLLWNGDRLDPRDDAIKALGKIRYTNAAHVLAKFMLEGRNIYGEDEDDESRRAEAAEALGKIAWQGSLADLKKALLSTWWIATKAIMALDQIDKTWGFTETEANRLVGELLDRIRENNKTHNDHYRRDELHSAVEVLEAVLLRHGSKISIERLREIEKFGDIYATQGVYNTSDTGDEFLTERHEYDNGNLRQLSQEELAKRSASA